MKQAKTSKAEEEALQEIVMKIGGKGAAVIVPILKDKDNVDEFKIANKANMTINELRNILYKLHHGDLVSFTRKKDSKKGWFIYYWTLNNERSLRSLIKDYKRDLTEQKDILENTLKKNYFVCPRGHIELGEESALEQSFECMECGELLMLKDRDVEKRKLNKIIDKLSRRLAELIELLEKYEKAMAARIEAETRKKKKKLKRKTKRTKKNGKARSKVGKAKKVGKKLRRKAGKMPRVKPKPKRKQKRVKKKAKVKGERKTKKKRKRR